MRFSAAMVLFAFPLVAAHAATFTVTNLNDSGAGSLRDAIAQANGTPGTNTVNFSVSGTLTLTTGQIDILNALNIVGPGQSQLTIDGNANGRMFRTLSGNGTCPPASGSSDFLVSISGLTLRNGSLPSGFNGGAVIARTSLTLDSVTIRDNVAQWGGGVMFFTAFPGQTLTITNSQFINNVAKPNLANNGSGNYRGGGALSATDNCGNRTPTSMTITGSTFTGNRLVPDPSSNVLAQGGAIALDFAGPVLIQDTRMVDNHADSNPLSLDIGLNGGAISAYAASLTVRRSEIAQNSADFVGGITALNEDPSLQTAGTAMQFLVIDSTVSGNVANQTFGGIAVGGNVAANISNSTVAANLANTLNEGPGVSGIAVGLTDPNQRAPTLQLVSSIVGSGPKAFPGIFAFDIPLPFSVTASNSLVQFVDPSVVLAGSGNLVGVSPQLGPLAFNGGPTRTLALLAGSPAINAGSNPQNLTTDQRGAGFRRTNGIATDIGAFEFVPALVYKPLAPCRIMDTRSATAGSGVQGPIAGNVLKTLPGFITAGQNWGQYGGNAASDCGLTSPPGASINAVALVATILNPNFDAYLGISDVNDLSTVLSNVALNYTATQGLSTMYIVPQIASNQIYFAMPAGLSAQLIYDVVGYYAAEDTTALQCTTQASAPVAIAAAGSGTATTPACAAGYTLTSGSCDSTSFTLDLTQSKASGGNTTWLCAATNRGGSLANLTATANCCRVPGR